MYRYSESTIGEMDFKRMSSLPRIPKNLASSRSAPQRVKKKKKGKKKNK